MLNIAEKLRPHLLRKLKIHDENYKEQGTLFLVQCFFLLFSTGKEIKKKGDS